MQLLVTKILLNPSFEELLQTRNEQIHNKFIIKLFEPVYFNQWVNNYKKIKQLYFASNENLSKIKTKGIEQI